MALGWLCHFTDISFLFEQFESRVWVVGIRSLISQVPLLLRFFSVSPSSGPFTCNELSQNRNHSIVTSEFQSIWLQVNNDLFQPLIVTIDVEIQFFFRNSVRSTVFRAVFGWKSCKHHPHGDTFGLSLVLLDRHNLIDNTFDIDLSDDFDKPASL